MKVGGGRGTLEPGSEASVANHGHGAVLYPDSFAFVPKIWHSCDTHVLVGFSHGAHLSVCVAHLQLLYQPHSQVTKNWNGLEMRLLLSTTLHLHSPTLCQHFDSF